jgi:hypothetical protein
MLCYSQESEYKPIIELVLRERDFSGAKLTAIYYLVLINDSLAFGLIYFG